LRRPGCTSLDIPPRERTRDENHSPNITSRKLNPPFFPHLRIFFSLLSFHSAILTSLGQNSDSDLTLGTWARIGHGATDRNWAPSKIPLLGNKNRNRKGLALGRQRTNHGHGELALAILFWVRAGSRPGIDWIRGAAWHGMWREKVSFILLSFFLAGLGLVGGEKEGTGGGKGVEVGFTCLVFSCKIYMPL
jgi:hypothetical protein